MLWYLARAERLFLGEGGACMDFEAKHVMSLALANGVRIIKYGA
jgi:hypothetical protein